MMDSEYFTITQPKSILDLPEDFFLEYLSKYLEIPELFNFRCCSRMCRDLVDQMLTRRKRLCIEEDSTQNNKWETSFRVISRKCRMLREIHLIGLPWLTEDLLLEFLNNNTELEIFSHHLCFKITSSGLHPLAVNCKKLHTLHLSGLAVCDGFLQTLNMHNNHLVDVSLSLYCLSEAILCDFFKTQIHLRIIHLSQKHFCKEHSPVLGTIAEYCKDLEYLDILDLDRSDDEAVLKIAKSCPKVTHIVLNPDEFCDGTIEFLKSRKIDIEQKVDILSSHRYDTFY
ncbi:F-box/LRR-repeat protein 15-like [Phlebotomus papatasi]|uniref:F-box/LRR-repeat protein 15-like n=1 Tax=Phlebotomus papatasi TaxID=29031 RepID=UPI002483F93E|nr:F-box/LRR-repeat protein 15-like [Phlebotomus papatasi]